MRYTDRSRIELDWTCPRARYWAYEYLPKGEEEQASSPSVPPPLQEGSRAIASTGLAPLEQPKELRFGGMMATQLERIKRGQPWTVEQFPALERDLAAALLTGYEDVVWPRWLRDYDVVSIEQEMPLVIDGWLTYNSRPDTITRRKVDGALFYGPEDKTTAWIDSLLSYASNIQLHATASMIEANMPGERVAGCLIQGLYKGFEKEGKLYHPLVYAHVKEGRAGIIPDQWSVKWVRGWERSETKYYPGGVRAWIKQLKAEDLAGVFPNSEPVTPNRPLVQRYLAQVVQREAEIRNWAMDGRASDPTTLAHVFPQHFNQCDGFGKGRKPCVWREACFNPTAQRFPMTFYRRRETHHPEHEDK